MGPGEIRLRFHHRRNGGKAEIRPALPGKHVAFHGFQNHDLHPVDHCAGKREITRRPKRQLPPHILTWFSVKQQKGALLLSGHPSAECSGTGKSPLQRDIPVLFRRVAFRLVGRHFQGLDQFLPGVAGINDLVDITHFGRFERAGKIVAVLLHFGLPLLGAHIFENNVHGTLGSHHGNFGCGEGIIHIRANVF